MAFSGTAHDQLALRQESGPPKTLEAAVQRLNVGWVVTSE